ncbi:Zn-dependent protease (includes SpoIVFB) [Gemmobacter aquatilis]|uniref:Zn-dependent protease (Includes SpoIVFB) n=1 Tax=Gemmobacter aquatilis TaxID=933059 RepID=A0A1H8M0V8_9RHOB|nr:site-2 protease family protein [Gemmobacter aquatilis]SEO10910.1 Zn-dependent protease (includes SpoIVFB) [Gemmobacter aquatilis]
MPGSEPTLLTLRGPFGIAVEVRQSAALLLMVFLLLFLVQGGSPLTALGLVAVVLGSILLHELGHAWGARVQGIAVQRIVIHGGGGTTETARSTARQEELIVAMGPLVNLSLWALLGLVMNGFYAHALTDPQIARLGYALLPWLSFASMVNLLLFAFNMVPVQPLDGGKLLLLGLRRLMPVAGAVRLAGQIGTVFCLLWWPALVWLFFATGWLLFFAPSLALHLAMAKGEQRL